MGAVACDCYICRVERKITPAPKAKDDGKYGEHLCPPCLKSPRHKNHPMNNRPASEYEDIPDMEKV